MRVYWPRRQAHFSLPRIGQNTGELVSEGPLVAASYPRQTLDPGKVSTVDTGYTTVVPAVAPPSDCVERHLLVDVITKVSCSSESQF